MANYYVITYARLSLGVVYMKEVLYYLFPREPWHAKWHLGVMRRAVWAVIYPTLLDRILSS